MTHEIKIEALAPNERKELPTELAFGTQFSDHMFVQDFHPDTGWSNAVVQALEPLPLHPAAAVLHYGQEIFEGLKAYRRADGEINLFRPEANFDRFNRSAKRMVMPEVDVAFHLQALKTLIALDERWVPTQSGASLYIRPAMIASTPKMGLGASAEYKHFIITGPVGPYFQVGFNPVSVYVSDYCRRAVVGGIGDAKTGGNYAASLQVSEEVAKDGYTQVLWLDAIEGRYVEEVGAMNICFVLEGEKIVTPTLSGSILPGITRDSLLTLAPALGYEVSEQQLDIHEMLEGIGTGKVTEVFGCGTAAVISPVGNLHFKGKDYAINDNKTGPVSRRLYDELTGIQYGTVEDCFGWTQTLS
ncbi:MAG: branched-chain amino acid aminotransferase [Pseudomonadota bacterium]